MMEKTKLTKLEWIFLIGCFVFFCIWAIQQPYMYAPDEEMRFHIPQYIFENGALPNGFDESLRSQPWGFSYAFYPCFLGPLVSALFMTITSIFTNDFFPLLVAARMTSVVSGTLTIYFTMKISRLWIKKEYRWLMPVLIAMLPQFIFLSSYVNNDIIAIMGSSVIVYAWSLGLRKWNAKNCILLAAGIIIVTLSYYNGYGWILGSIFLFILSFAFKTGQNQGGMKQMWKMGVLVSAIVLIFVSFFFIRNALLYQGDFLGMSSLTRSSELYAADYLKPTNRPTPHNLGMTLGEMMSTLDYTDMTWPHMSYISLIGVLGTMNIFISTKIYLLYGCILVFGAVAFLIRFCTGIKRITEKKSYILFHILMFLGLCIPIILSIYYSYFTDYQAQGRYCATMLPALMYFTASGLSWILEKLEPLLGQKCTKVLAFLFCSGLVYVASRVYLFSFLPSLL